MPPPGTVAALVTRVSASRGEASTISEGRNEFAADGRQAGLARAASASRRRRAPTTAARAATPAAATGPGHGRLRGQRVHARGDPLNTRGAGSRGLSSHKGRQNHRWCTSYRIPGRGRGWDPRPWLHCDRAGCGASLLRLRRLRAGHHQAGQKEGQGLLLPLRPSIQHGAAGLCLLHQQKGCLQRWLALPPLCCPWHLL